MQALLAALGDSEEVRVALTRRERRLHLQTAYGQALMWSKGFAADETESAFARAADLAAKSDDFSQRFAAAHGQWTLAHVRGDLRTARERATTFLREAENLGRMVEVGVANRGLAVIHYFSGDFIKARTHCERALDVCDPERDQVARERFGEDTSAMALSNLALANWQLGEVERAREMIDAALARAAALGHPPSLAQPLHRKAYLALLRGDAATALSTAETLRALSREHGMTYWAVLAEIATGWAHGRLGDPEAGAAELRQAMAAYASQGAVTDAASFETRLAELEAETLGADRALARVDAALALALQVDHGFDLAFMHRLRGDLLLKSDPSDPAPAEDAYRAAIAIAKEQGARTYDLLASLSLAKLCHSTARPAYAHAVLAPALEGFSPTQGMPEIAEARALLAALGSVGDALLQQ